MVNRSATLVPLLLTIGPLGCKPAEEGRPSLLDVPRILAIQSSPADAPPGTEVTVDVLRAGPEGQVDSAAVELDFCVQRKPLAAPGMLASACLEKGPNDALVPIENAQPITSTIPADACAIFGPKPPAPEPNQPPLRPVDPDTTGGYYQPLRALDGDSSSVGFVRIMCGLTGTTQDNSVEFGQRYRANENPRIEQVFFATNGGEAAVLDLDVPAEVRPNQQLSLAVVWNDCNGSESCSGAESYLILDPTTNQLRFQRESMRVSWYVTGGTLDRDRSGRSGEDAANDAQNVWVAPSAPGDHTLIAVIRDDRGGVGWVARLLHVAK
jgi:hypothetical protein